METTQLRYPEERYEDERRIKKYIATQRRRGQSVRHNNGQKQNAAFVLRFRFPGMTGTAVMTRDGMCGGDKVIMSEIVPASGMERGSGGEFICSPSWIWRGVVGREVFAHLQAFLFLHEVFVRHQESVWSYSHSCSKARNESGRKA